jgi:hypothetical protein
VVVDADLGIFFVVECSVDINFERHGRDSPEKGTWLFDQQQTYGLLIN